MPVCHIAFRTDASSEIGTGHFMRCLTLADELRKTGAEIRFICRELPAHLAEMLTEKGISHFPLTGEPPAPHASNLAHSHWLWTDQEHDAQVCLQALEGQTWDWVVVDHYALDHRWESRMRIAASKIMVIDDLADRRHECDLLLDQNYYIDMDERYRDKVSEDCRLLLGPRYALLREEFRALRKQDVPRSGDIRRILVFFGGIDADNFTGQAIQALVRLNLKALHVDVVIGARHPQLSDIKNSCIAAGFTCHVQTPHMAELMATADLAIGAGGIATWERCCLGLPTLAFSVAENQRAQIRDAAEIGLLLTANVSADIPSAICRQISALIDNPILLRLTSRTASAQVDGKGSLRILTALGANNIHIRRATIADARNLFDWRNHPDIRAVSYSHAELDWPSHLQWVEQTLQRADRELLIGELDGRALGVVRFDFQDITAEVSIYLVPDAGFSGQGRNLLLAAEHWMRIHHPKIGRVAASVLGDNMPSQGLFLGAGYKMQDIHYIKELQD
ncbi:MAG: UDP-2,4-diacetamido-2,4,6-trideoxy-beta-L-altropyranose hydrolase [Sideroxydans sp.]|nr:UDP-2,4-diacetamido-2,4,6-trideoxy-beta-L-altropyranose hydrolase [Sideroxydans sp.]